MPRPRPEILAMLGLSACVNPVRLLVDAVQEPSMTAETAAETHPDSTPGLTEVGAEVEVQTAPEPARVPADRGVLPSASRPRPPPRFRDRPQPMYGVP